MTQCSPPTERRQKRRRRQLASPCMHQNQSLAQQAPCQPHNKVQRAAPWSSWEYIWLHLAHCLTRWRLWQHNASSTARPLVPAHEHTAGQNALSNSLPAWKHSSQSSELTQGPGALRGQPSRWAQCRDAWPAWSPTVASGCRLCTAWACPQHPAVCSPFSSPLPAGVGAVSRLLLALGCRTAGCQCVRAAVTLHERQSHTGRLLEAEVEAVRACVRLVCVMQDVRVPDKQATQRLLCSTYQAMLVAMNDARHDPDSQALASSVPRHRV